MTDEFDDIDNPEPEPQFAEAQLSAGPSPVDLAEMALVEAELDQRWPETKIEPSLTRINLTPPYFHDGRYKTMEELLADPNSKMGNTSKLSAEERDALTVYLQSL